MHNQWVMLEISYLAMELPQCLGDDRLIDFSINLFLFPVLHLTALSELRKQNSTYSCVSM